MFSSTPVILFSWYTVKSLFDNDLFKVKNIFESGSNAQPRISIICRFEVFLGTFRCLKQSSACYKKKFHPLWKHLWMTLWQVVSSFPLRQKKNIPNEAVMQWILGQEWVTLRDPFLSTSAEEESVRKGLHSLCSVCVLVDVARLYKILQAVFTKACQQTCHQCACRTVCLRPQCSASTKASFSSSAGWGQNIEQATFFLLGTGFKM